MPNNKKIISASEDKSLRIWSIHKQRQIYYKEFVYPITCLALTQDTTHILCATGDKSIKVLNFQTKLQKCSLSGHRSRINSLISTPDSNFIISASDDRTIRIFSLKKCVQESFMIGHEASIHTLLLSKPLLLVSASYDYTIRLWNVNLKHKVPHLSKISVFQKFLTPVLCVDSENCVKVAIGCYDGSVKVWNTKSNKIEKDFKAHLDSVNGVKVSGGLLATCSADKSLKIWEFETLNKIENLQFVDMVVKMAWSSDTMTLVSAGHDKTMYVYSLPHKKMLTELSGHSGDITCIYHFPNQDLLASASADNSVRLWDLSHKRLTHIYKGHHSRITSLSVNDSGELIASGSWDKSVKIWNVHRRFLSQSFENHDWAVTSVKFSNSNKYVVSITEFKIYVWRVI